MILVLRALKLGDLLTAVPALRAIRRAFPDDEIVLAAPAWLEPLALHTGAVDRLVDTAPLAPIDRSLRGADVAVNLHGRGPQSTGVLFELTPRRLIAFDIPGGAAWREGEHERTRWCRLLDEAGIPADPEDFRLAVPDLTPPVPMAGATVVHPGASTTARRWPASRWAVVAEQEVAAGHRVVVTGDESELELAGRVAGLAGLGKGRVLAGRTGLLDLLAVVASAGRVVCGDTGVAHVASAMGTPSVVLFGPTSPACWGPPLYGPHVTLWTGRTGDPDGDQPHAGLLSIEVDDVLDALRRLETVTPGARAGCP
jgi:ADP-heptose:LPS heptosyltransferase